MRRLAAPVALILLMLALQANGAARAAEPILVRTAMQSGALAKYAPDDAASPGLCLEILRAVERIDPGLRFVGLALRAPLLRIERMLALGEIDMFFCLLKSPERARQWHYLPVPLYRIRQMAVQRISDPTELRSMADLVAAGLKKPVLVPQGTLLAATLHRANVAIGFAPSEREALQMLQLGRTDVVYGQDVNLLRNIRAAGLGDRVRLSPTVCQEADQYATGSKRMSPELALRLTQALQQLERDGSLRAIAEKYK